MFFLFVFLFVARFCDSSIKAFLLLCTMHVDVAQSAMGQRSVGELEERPDGHAQAQLDGQPGAARGQRRQRHDPHAGADVWAGT